MYLPYLNQIIFEYSGMVACDTMDGYSDGMRGIRVAECRSCLKGTFSVDLDTTKLK